MSTGSEGEKALYRSRQPMNSWSGRTTKNRAQEAASSGSGSKKRPLTKPQTATGTVAAAQTASRPQAAGTSSRGSSAATTSAARIRATTAAIGRICPPRSSPTERIVLFAAACVRAD